MRIRLRFAKHGKVRFTSHRDVARIWERALRRVRLPVARSQGFSPRPRLHFGLALPTGCESDAEYIDVDLVEGATVDLAVLPDALTRALPRGLTATAAGEVPVGTPSLQHAVTSSRWEIEVRDLDATALLGRVEALLAAPELVTARQRKGRDVLDDVRPHLLHLEVVDRDPHPVLVAELGIRDRGLRPSELVALVGEGAVEGVVRRTHQFIDDDGVRAEPLALSDESGAGPDPSAPSSAHAMERAS